MFKDNKLETESMHLSKPSLVCKARLRPLLNSVVGPGFHIVAFNIYDVTNPVTVNLTKSPISLLPKRIVWMFRFKHSIDVLKLTLGGVSYDMPLLELRYISS